MHEKLLMGTKDFDLEHALVHWSYICKYKYNGQQCVNFIDSIFCIIYVPKYSLCTLLCVENIIWNVLYDSRRIIIEIHFCEP